MVETSDLKSLHSRFPLHTLDHDGSWEVVKYGGVDRDES